MAISFFILLLAALGLAAIIWAWQLRRQSGIPWARVTYDDAGRREIIQPLRSVRYGLVGRPDYVLERRGALIPVEVKPHRRATAPYHADVMQLVAYCLLVEETSGHRPRFGLLRYAEATFQIVYNDQLRDDLLDTLDQMRDDLVADDCDRDHHEPGRCRGCGFVEVCEQALA